jgi:hypothetical protein
MAECPIGAHDPPSKGDVAPGVYGTRWPLRSRACEFSSGTETGIQPLYLARIEDLGRGDLVQVDCAACHHVALLTPDFLQRLGPSPQGRVLDHKSPVWCRGWGEGAGCRIGQVGAAGRLSGAVSYPSDKPTKIRSAGGERAPGG